MGRAESHISLPWLILVLQTPMSFSRITRTISCHRTRGGGFELFFALGGRNIRMEDDPLPSQSDLAMMTCIQDIWLRGSNESETPRRIQRLTEKDLYRLLEPWLG